MKTQSTKFLHGKDTTVMVVAALVIGASAFFLGLRFPNLHVGSPTIIATLADNIQKNGAIILFATPIPTKGYVFYSESIPTPASLNTGGLYTRELHDFYLPNLKPDTTYQYYVVAVDPLTGAKGQSEVSTFKTLK